MLAETAAAWFACKAVLTAAQAAACRSFEVDLSLTTDGVLVVSHDPVPYAWKDAGGRLVDLDAFVAELADRSFDHVNLDIKERALGWGDRRLTRAFARHAQALKALDAASRHLIVSSPVPARYEEIEAWLSSAKLRARAGYELADYDAEQSRRWGVPFGPAQAALLPVARLVSRLYLRRRASRIPYLIVQESTAAKGGLPEGPTVVCWTRDPASGPPPARCRWTQRRAPTPRPTAPGAARSRSPRRP